MQRALSRVVPLVLPSVAAVLLAGCATTSLPSTAPGSTVVPTAIPNLWAGAWGAALDNAAATHDNTGGTDQTFRFLITPTVGGTEERVRFANPFGTSAITVGAARLAVGQDGSAAIDPTHDALLTFAGQTSVQLAPGATVTSDPVHVAYSFGQTLAVSLFVKGAFGQLSRHSSIFVTNYRSPDAAGDSTADATGASLTGTLTDWLLLSGLDVYGPYRGTIALFGSSTTDGYHSNYGADKVYPTPNVPVPGQHTSRLSDWLARRLNTAGLQIGVVNLGIPGDTVTPDITNTINDVQNANDRFARDVLPVPSLLGVLTYFGSIDIRSPDCKSAPAIEASTRQLIASADAAHVPILLATIPPSAFCSNPSQTNYGPVPNPSDPYAGGATPGPANGGALQRIAFNTWLRSTASTLPGVAGIADFDLALADPGRPDFLLAPFNSGDNYHPTGTGYHAESDVIPYTLLLPTTVNPPPTTHEH